MKHCLRIATLLSAVLAAAAVAGACTIEIRGDGTPRSMLHHAKSVFTGEVLEITSTPKEIEASSFAVRLRVNRFWKGVKTREVIVHTDMNSCGPHFDVGREYLVYGFGKELETRYSRTRELRFADEDLRAIGPGKELKQK